VLSLIICPVDKSGDGVGVIECMAGVVANRPGFICILGGHRRMLLKWVRDSCLAWAKAGFEGEVRFDVFVWGWGNLGRNFQVLLVTLPHPESLRGYVAYMVVMDVKSKADYEIALAPFLQALEAALAKFNLPLTAVRFHCDEEDALTAVFEDAGCDIVGCRFHKLQNLTAQIKGRFPKRM
jgi:hypothetical protein